MKIAFLISRILLGLIFTIFGLNGFLHFIPMGPLPTGLAGQYFTAVSESHYLTVIFAFQLICGILLLVNQFVPLVVTILAAIIANILLFHITMAPAGLPLAFFTLLLWIIVFAGVRQHFAGIFTQKTTL
jgi:putative oxidoreductase